MKLFALATTTAVTGRRTWRVDTPAPGFVNEQGGYWADQTSDQSRHYQQAPQRSYQKPQCANGYFFTAPGESEAVFMEEIGEHDNKPIYSGWFDKREQFLYWAWDRQSNQTNADLQAAPGNWYFGKTVGHPEAISSSTTYGLSNCPTDQQVSWLQFDDNGSHIENQISIYAGQEWGHLMKKWSVFRCCDKFHLTINKGEAAEETILMERRPPNHDSGMVRSYYKGRNVEKYLYFKFIEGEFMQSVPDFARSGKWYLGNSLNDVDNETETIEYGFTTCPNDALIEPLFKTPVDLECAGVDKNLLRHHRVQSCENKVKNAHRADLFLNYHLNDVDVCNLDAVYNDLARNQLQQLLILRPDAQGQGVVNGIFDEIRRTYTQMVTNKCLKATFFQSKYYVEGCSEVCKNIVDLKRSEDMAAFFVATWDLIKTQYKGLFWF